jgi:hypothetical protein
MLDPVLVDVEGFLLPRVHEHMHVDDYSDNRHAKLPESPLSGEKNLFD